MIMKREQMKECPRQWGMIVTLEKRLWVISNYNCLHLISKKTPSNVNGKQGLSKPPNANVVPFFFGMQDTSNLTNIPSNVLNGQFCNQMPGLSCITLPNNLGSICSGMQGGLGGLSNVNMGQWNPF
jgi:hypothetical protein